MCGPLRALPCRWPIAAVARLLALTFFAGSCSAVEDVPAWQVLQGSEDEEGLITYGKTLAAKILILPAFSTVDKTCEEVRAG